MSVGVITPAFASGELLSASKLTRYNQLLLACKAVADRPRAVAVEVVPGNGNTTTGYLYHQYDSLVYYVEDYTNATLTVNGTGVSLTGVSGTADISGLSLTVGQVYTVTLAAASADVKARYIYETHTETYGTGPVSFTGNTAAQVTTNLGIVRNYVDDLINLANVPPTAFVEVSHDEGGWDRVNESEFTVLTGWLRHQADTLQFKYWHQVVSGGTSSAKSKITISINGSEAIALRIGDSTYTGATVTLYPTSASVSHGQWGRAETVVGTVDISGLSLTVGTWYKYEIKQKGTGTDKNMDLTFRAEWLAEASNSPTWASLQTWVPGAKTASDTNLNKFVTAINYLHPGAASPTSPIYYDNLVQWYLDDDWHMNRTGKYLIYRPSGTGKPNVTYGGNSFSLVNGTGNLVYDLDKIPNLFDGMRFAIDDCAFGKVVSDAENVS